MDDRRHFNVRIEVVTPGDQGPRVVQAISDAIPEARTIVGDTSVTVLRLRVSASSREEAMLTGRALVSDALVRADTSRVGDDPPISHLELRTLGAALAQP